ncbi:hypothetical protein M9H77_04360 [Catharanthus roseus]|uniref:Uncharacterized protein n=1 Tax=Catharanthus roseus TaxID=4058 RepID=A0ACC0CE35_CATRO|nr:hypothetical protein M9H77_04360 [Catharanthus roseus]
MKGEIDVIHKVINIDFDSLEQDILDPENEDKRNWYSQVDSFYQEKIKQEWINDINRLNTPFNFFCWLEYFLIKLGIEEDPFKISYINVQTSLAKKGKLNDGNIVTQTHPPLQSIRLDTPDGEIIASPFKKGKDSDDSIKIYSSPHFQPSTLSRDQEAKLTLPSSSQSILTSSSPLLSKISQTLEKINSNLPSSSKINTIDQEENDDSISSRHDSSFSSDNELIQKISQVEDSFLEPQEIAHNNINKICRNKFSKFSNTRWKTSDTRNYYPRPTPPSRYSI